MFKHAEKKTLKELAEVPIKGVRGVSWGSPRSSRQCRCLGIALGGHSAIVSLVSQSDSLIFLGVFHLLGKRTRTLAVTSITTVSAFELFETESLLRVPPMATHCSSTF